MRYKPPGVSVFVIQKEKVVLFKEAENSPASSFSGSPSGSGHLSSQGPSGPLEPTYSGAFQDSGERACHDSCRRHPLSCCA